ncbi:MAG: septum formation initiator family protein [Patescibacteria group bacterium]
MAKKQFPQSSHYAIAPKRILGSAIALVVFFLLLTSVIGLAQKYFALKARSQELTEDQARLAEKRTALTTTNAYLATPEGTEESLRERYNYIKPGEQIIVITPEQTVDAEAEKRSVVGHWWDTVLRGLGIRKDAE